jgi:LysM repeat protein
MDYLSKKIKQSSKRSLARPFFCLIFGLVGISCLGLFFWIFSSKSANKISLSASLLKNGSQTDLFLEPAKNFAAESPEIVFVQKNSIERVCSPSTASMQTLAAEIGGDLQIAEERTDVIEYTIAEGDTISSLATKFNISVDTILWANELTKTSKIKLGQKLMILPVSGVLHIAENGDTLSKIAASYKTKVADIIAFNNLSDEGDIFIGDILIIPSGVMPIKSSPSYSIPIASSYFILPCEGTITQGLHFSNAIDVANQCGKPIVAAASGAVQRAGYNKVSGNRVTIIHPNGVVTYYGHLSTILVKPGQQVIAGDIIGYVGNTGYTIGATGCHLHFEVIGATNFLSRYNLGSYLTWKK